MNRTKLNLMIMSEGLTMFFACLIAAAIIILLTWLLFKYNPIYINYEINFMDEGEVRWDKGSPKYGRDHRIDVITKINKKKVLFFFKRYEIEFDRYIENEKGEYKYSESLVWKGKTFIQFTMPEPVKKEERICDSKK